MGPLLFSDVHVCIYMCVCHIVLAGWPCLAAETCSRKMGFLPMPVSVHLKSSVKDGVAEHCECQQSQQQLGSLEVFLDQLWHSLGLHHLIDGAVCS